MPIYGYVCQNCGHAMDALQKISDDPLVDCPACGEAALKRQLSAPRFRLKGKGWYETDFKTDNQRNLAGDSGEAGSDSKADKAGKADKADKKSEARSDKGKSDKGTSKASTA